MAYESLYRRYRPRRFSEVRGQDDVVRALRNAVREDRVGHAYLFSGPRGTGKTSTARILAKALNCTNLADGEPCCECESCLSIEAGTSYDLLELDAASNNGVDAMRDLIAKASLGSPGRTKVYILDEVHMLSTGASNALLKTLEEPPGHVVFVLATTDPHKVLPTIRSRTQHFELHLLPAADLDALVHEVVADAHLELDDDAIAYALAAGGGSARDTLSALDQVVAAGGVLDRGDEVDELVDALVDADTGAALRGVSEAVRRGHDPRVVGEALLARVRDVFLHRMGDPLGHLPEAARAKVVSWAERFSDRACTRALEAIGDALREMRQAPDARIPLEVALVRLTRPDADASLDSLVQRIERLERGAPAATASPSEGASSRPTASAGSSNVGDVAPSSITAPAEGSAPPPAADAAAASSPGARTGGRPLDAARALLADRPASESTRRTPTPVAAAPTGAPPVPGVAASSTSAEAPSLQTPPPSEPTGGPAAPTPEAAPPAAARPAPTREAEQPAASSSSAATGGLPSLDELTSAWSAAVLPRLAGLTKAMYAAGRFLDSTGPKARFTVPNAVHREKAGQKLGEVEAALAAHFGRPVPLELVVDEGAGATGPSTAATGTDTAASRPPATETGPEEDVGDITELEDAPADDRSAAQRVIETFPGAEIVDN
jgi:DNA polymerase-3 subunit gamma/tau